MQRPNGVPSGACPLYATNVPYQAAFLVGFQELVDDYNQKQELLYRYDCENWLARNTRNRDLGLPIDPKPAMRYKEVLRTFNGPDGTVWFWTEPTTPVGEPCPDLPPSQAANPPGTPMIGNLVPGTTEYFQCLRGDTMPDYAVVNVPPAQGPEAGSYLKVPNPFGAVYKKIGKEPVLQADHGR